MVSEKVIISNSQGFHMRPASTFAGAMAKYKSDVSIVFKDNAINGKSLMNIIAAGIKCGSEIEIKCEGSDEAAALAEAVKLVKSGFDE